MQTDVEAKLAALNDNRTDFIEIRRSTFKELVEITREFEIRISQFKTRIWTFGVSCAVAGVMVGIIIRGLI